MAEAPEQATGGRAHSRIGRRGALALGAAGVAAWMAMPHLASRLGGRFDFTPLDDPPGFRRLVADSAAVTSDPFIGIDLRRTPAPQTTATLPPLDGAAFCAALFGAPPQAGVVPIAFFTDINCPFCRVLKQRLASLRAREGDGLRLTWHEWPLLGPTSVTMARAALAAERQGRYAAFHARTGQGRVVPTPAYLVLVAEEIGLDVARFTRDMASGEVTARLARSDQLARRLRFVGTPGLVVGRTVVTGAISARELRALVRRERRDGPPPLCAG